MIDKKIYTNYKDAGYSIIPLVREVEARGDTPLSLYLKVANQKNTFLLESVEGERSGRNILLLGLTALTQLKFQETPSSKVLAEKKKFLIPIIP